MKINILNIKIDALTYNEALEKVESFFAPNLPASRCLPEMPSRQAGSARGKQIITANPEIILAAQKNPEYKSLINSSSLVLADGIGLLWAAKFLSLKSSSIFTSIIQAFVCGTSLIFSPEYCQQILPQRITGVDLMEKICEKATKNKWRIYLLGAGDRVAEKTAETLKNKYSDLQIVGYNSGPNFQLPTSRQTSQTNFQPHLDKINQSQPDILFVAFGAPKQDFFIQEILPQLPSVKLAMGVGGAFDFISGKTKRAPLIYQDLSIEWLWRLFNQPWRFLRIFNATIKFIYYTVKYKHDSKN